MKAQVIGPFGAAAQKWGFPAQRDHLEFDKETGKEPTHVDHVSPVTKKKCFRPAKILKSGF